jgi:hypothetical protein
MKQANVDLDLTFLRIEFISIIFRSLVNSSQKRQRVFAKETNTLLLFRKKFVTYCEIDKDFNVKTSGSYKGRCYLKSKIELNIRQNC